MNCPVCQTKIEDHFGMVQCSHCLTTLMIDIDGKISFLKDQNSTESNVQEENKEGQKSTEEFNEKLDDERLNHEEPKEITKEEEREEKGDFSFSENQENQEVQREEQNIQENERPEDEIQDQEEPLEQNESLSDEAFSLEKKEENSPIEGESTEEDASVEEAESIEEKVPFEDEGSVGAEEVSMEEGAPMQEEGSMEEGASMQEEGPMEEEGSMPEEGLTGEELVGEEVQSREAVSNQREEASNQEGEIHSEGSQEEAHSSEAKKAKKTNQKSNRNPFLHYDVVISNIQMKKTKDAIKDVLADEKFLWDSEQMIHSIKNRTLKIENVSAIKASLLISRIKHLDVEICWEPVEKSTS